MSFASRRAARRKRRSARRARWKSRFRKVGRVFKKYGSKMLSIGGSIVGGIVSVIPGGQAIGPLIVMGSVAGGKAIEAAQKKDGRGALKALANGAVDMAATRSPAVASVRSGITSTIKRPKQAASQILGEVNTKQAASRILG